jgi:subtilisin family serine protease
VADLPSQLNNALKPLAIKMLHPELADMRRWLYGAAAVLSLAACAEDKDFMTEPSRGDTPSPARVNPKAIPGHYIVVLKDGIDNVAVATEHTFARGAAVSHRYQHALNGYAAQLTPAALAAIEGDARVAFVAEDREFSISPDRELLAASTCDPTNFTPPRQCLPAGIDRIDGDRSSTGSGDGRVRVNVNVLVMDTGINTRHPDLNIAGGIECAGEGFEDFHGHGTHVAGTIGAKDNGIGVVGVAPGARLWAAGVFHRNGNARNSTIICAIDWATATRTDRDPTNDIAVANMSLSGPGVDDDDCGATSRDPLHRAICRSTAAGVTYVVAAGNESTDVAGSVPAAYDEVLTVTAMTDFDGKHGADFRGDHPCFPDEPSLPRARDDRAVFFSNFATRPADRAHTVAAPGVCILSTDLTTGGFTGYFAFSGTSQATPHVAGTVALCIASGPCAGLTPERIIKKIVNRAAAHNTANPDYGFIGDPIRPIGRKYFGYLVRAGAY